MKVKDRIALNRNAKTGESIICPICRKEFVKKSYQHTFCSLACKDKRHNMINSDRHSDPDYYEKYNIRNGRTLNISHLYIHDKSFEDDVMSQLRDTDFGTYYGDQD